MESNQINLLLWKNYLIRKRNRMILALVFLWPIIIFMLLYAVRDNVDPEYNPTCQFRGRLMPHDGLLPFVQSYICSISNPCESLDKYEEVPSYSQAKLTGLITELQTFLRNETILTAISALPQSIQFLKSMTEMLTQPEIKKIFIDGIRLGDLVNNHGGVKQSLKKQLSSEKDNFLDNLFNASINLPYVIKFLSSSGIDKITCSTEKLKQYLIVQTEQDFITISQGLCNLDNSQIPKLIEQLAKHFNFNSLRQVISDVMDKFGNYNLIDDVVAAIKTILGFEIWKQYIPEYFKIQQWIPEVIAILKNVDIEDSVAFINQSIQRMEPIFIADKNWYLARHGLYKLSTLLALINDLLKKQEIQNNKIKGLNYFDVSEHIYNSSEIQEFTVDTEDVTQALDLTYIILQDAGTLISKLLRYHKKEIPNSSMEILQTLKNIFSQKFISTLSYVTSFAENIARMIHHAAIMQKDIPRRFFHILQKHKELINQITVGFKPDIYKVMINSFSRLDFIENLINIFKRSQPAIAVCERDILQEIFQNTTDYYAKVNPQQLACDDEAKLFITDTYNLFEFQNFRIIVENILSTFINVALSRSMSIEKYNLTSSVRSIKNLHYYLTYDAVTIKTINWDELNITDEWIQVVKDTQVQGKSNILGYFLSIVKDVGFNSLSYMVIKPYLENIEVIIDLIIKDLENDESSTNWVAQVQSHRIQLLETFYLTISDRNKTLDLFEYYDFTKSFCIEKDFPELVQYPMGSNATLLKDLVCKIMNAIQAKLDVNLTEFEKQKIKDEHAFDWTVFNQKLIQIYSFIDTPVNGSDDGLNERFIELKANFERAWFDDLPARVAMESSVGILCKMFMLAESPLLQMQKRSEWQYLHAIAWAVATIFDSAESVLDNILNDNSTVQSPKVINVMFHTQILLNSIIRNAAAIIQDVDSIFSQKSPMHYITILYSYFTTEKDWPCYPKQSLGDALELPSLTQDLIHEVEKIICDPKPFVEEWTTETTLLRVYKIFNGSKIDPVPNFNWTLGYSNFRQLIRKFITVINPITYSTVDNYDNVNTSNAMSEAQNFLEKVISKFKTAQDLLDFIDLLIDDNIEVFKSNLSAKEVWKSKKEINITDKILVMMKFTSVVLYDGIDVATEIVNCTKNTNLLNLLGFTPKTVPFLIRTKLPAIFGTIINIISNFNFENRFKNDLKSDSAICSKVFYWFYDHEIGLTNGEYKALKNFVCEGDTKYFNVLFEFYLRESEYWESPVSKYRLYLITLIEKLYNYNDIIQIIAKEQLNINPVVDGAYFREVADSLVEILGSPKLIQTAEFNFEWSTYGLIIQGFSEVLNNAAEALMDFNPNNVLHIWNLFPSNDSHPMLKFLETNPVETISLFATLANFNSTLTSFELIRYTMCELNLNSDFWLRPKEKDFINTLCGWFQYKILKSLTSEDYFNLILYKNEKFLKNMKPLPHNLQKFLKAWLNINKKMNDKELSFKSNIFNFTTWANLPRDTRRLIYDAEKTWFFKTMKFFQFYNSETENLHKFGYLIQIIENIKSWIDLTTGGDIWDKLTSTFESPKMRVLFNLVEKSPNLLISILDTFLNSDNLNNFVQNYVNGEINICDIKNYLISPTYIEDADVAVTTKDRSIITDFCENFVFNSNFTENFKSVISSKYLPAPNTLREDITKSEYKRSIDNSVNRYYLFDQLEKAQWDLFFALRTGYKPIVKPHWLTSFEESTWKSFRNQFESKNLKIISQSIVHKFIKIVESILKFIIKDNDCSWCNSGFIDIVNSQLKYHKVYTKILCNYRHKSLAKIQEIINTELHWNNTIDLIKSLELDNHTENITKFLNTVETALNLIVDIILIYKNPASQSNAEKCLIEAIHDVKNFSPLVYEKIAIGIIEAVQNNINTTDFIDNSDLWNHTKIAEKFVPIWKPLDSIVKKSAVDKIKKLIPNAIFNVNSAYYRNFNCTINNCNNAIYFVDILNSTAVRNLFKYDDFSNLTISDISAIFAENLDFDLITKEIKIWKSEASLNLTWLKNIIKELCIILEEGNKLLKIATKVDFEDLSSLTKDPDLNQIFVGVLRNKSIEHFFNGFHGILFNVEGFFESKSVPLDLHKMLDTLQSMEIFKNLRLLDIKFAIPEMLSEWQLLSTFLIDHLNFSNDTVVALSQAKVDMLMIFLKEGSSVDLKELVCPQEQSNAVLDFKSLDNAEETITALCNLNAITLQNIVITLVQNLKYDYIFKKLMSVNVGTILQNANLTEDEGKVIFDNIEVTSELVMSFRNKMTGQINSSSLQNDTKDDMSVEEFLDYGNEVICGVQSSSDSGDLHQILSSIEDHNLNLNQMELDSLPSDFCRDLYKTVIKMTGGKIIWTYIKPLLRGRIFYAPYSSMTAKIMHHANKTFKEIEAFGNLLMSFEVTLTSLSNLTSMEDNLKNLMQIMHSELMKVVIKSIGNGQMSNLNFDFSEMNLNLKESAGLVKTINLLRNFIECVLSDRIVGLENEEELEVEARRLMDTHEFLAGIIFLNTNDKINKRNTLNDQMPDDIKYKIRMDVDYVPSTKKLKSQFWLPGPEGSFIEDLRYLRGFIQLQDSIDRAIIEVKSGKVSDWKTISQQMPYPCWKHTPFQSTLYESQGLVVCFFFALMMSVGSAVHYIVWERESQNEMIMSVMGLKYWKNVIAWFITSFIEFTIVAITIFCILVFGKILPHSDPTLIFALLADYMFSLVTFSYMISTMFSSASLAAVTGNIMCLLTYMPYIIVIAMESNLEFAYNLILCLSMSTSFSYGCLYTARLEVQGVGVNWRTIWDESNSNNKMSLGLVMIMIGLDGILYGIIGFIITRYKSSDKGRSNDNIIVKEQEVDVRFEAIKKIYQTGSKERVAVDNFTLNLRKGEITSLLGRNGAGKTTIIKILTGMIKPTYGQIYLNGHGAEKPHIGVCPQENVLIDVLTPKEHMLLYAKLKRHLSTKEITKHVNAMLAILELGKKEHEPVSRLSGGTRRRLCVALAFLCSPQLVILDEPCAGVDPGSRRRIWSLIEQYKVNTTILLSTHYLDEAEMLSDTIVIMNRGKILYSGSPLSLKITHGEGYWINTMFPDGKFREFEQSRKSIEKCQTLLECVTSNATFDSSSDAVTINLPFRSNDGTPNDVAAVIKILENNRESLHFSHISLKCDTLDRIFQNLCKEEDGTEPTLQSSAISIPSTSTAHNNSTVELISNDSVNPSAIKQVAALLKKRVWHFMRDWRAPLATLILPTLFVAIAMGFSLIRPPSSDEPALDLDPELYGNEQTYFYSMNKEDVFINDVALQITRRFSEDEKEDIQTIFPNHTASCECREGQHICEQTSRRELGLLRTLPGRPTLHWIINTFHEHIEKRYGGWSLSHWRKDPLFIVWFNNKGHHTLPAYLNALNNAILRASGLPGRLTTFNHPLKLSSDQLNRTTLLQHVADVGIALVLLIAFNLVAAQGAKELVRERLSEEKRILYLAGVHPITYWATALIWDMLIFLASIGLAAGIFQLFGLPAYVERDNLPGICLLLLLFSWASIPFTHLFEKIFRNSSLPNMVLFCLNTFIGVICLASILVLDILGKTQTEKDIRKLLHNILLVFPQYALGDALVQIATNDITAELLQKFNMDTYKSPLGWSLIGTHYTFLFIVGIILHIVNICVEYKVFFYCQRRRSSPDILYEDEDVAEERFRVENQATTDVLKTIKLTKEYQSVYGRTVAVQNLSVGIQAGTCFGLLGINGAGKSTIFKMLTTELIPTAGKILLHNKEVGVKPLLNGQISYCPQSDALDGFLSPHQCLTIHAEVCGFRNVSKVVRTMLHSFELQQYAHQRVSSLSGGNKRKLCTAISVMAPASVILMDEPTSGMDPTSKQLIARVIKQIIQAQRVIILSSHSVAELENLCNRVGILANAGLRAIGSVQHLKHKFGESYIVFLRFRRPVTLIDLKDAIIKHLNCAQISSRQSMTARLILKNPGTMLNVTFLKVKQLAMELDTIDYTLTQSSLDQMLASFSDALEENVSDLHFYSNFVQKNSSMARNIRMNTFKGEVEK